jgi:hypothetical protein
MLCFFGFWAHPRYAGSGFPLQFLSLPAVGLRDFRFNPLRKGGHREVIAKASGEEDLYTNE